MAVLRLMCKCIKTWSLFSIERMEEGCLSKPKYQGQRLEHPFYWNYREVNKVNFYEVKKEWRDVCLI